MGYTSLDVPASSGSEAIRWLVAQVELGQVQVLVRVGAVS